MPLPAVGFPVTVNGGQTLAQVLSHLLELLGSAVSMYSALPAPVPSTLPYPGTVMIATVLDESPEGAEAVEEVAAAPEDEAPPVLARPPEEDDPQAPTSSAIDTAAQMCVTRLEALIMWNRSG